MNRSPALHPHHGHHIGLTALARQGVAAVKSFASKNIVLIIAATLALVSCFIVPPDAKYAGYFDLKTLTCLFCTLMAFVCLYYLKVIRSLSFPLCSMFMLYPIL